MKLSARVDVGFKGNPFIGMVDDPTLDRRAPPARRLLLRRQTREDPFPGGPELHLIAPESGQSGAVRLPADFDYLRAGDIVRVNPQTREIRVLYRKSSRHNVLFFTERCNSRCLMCSQPPREVNDDYLIDDILQFIPWMAEDTRELGITGGEPTLHQRKLIEVVDAAKRNLPKTALHMLSNGRLFAYLRLTEQLASVQHPDLMVGVPLYGDTTSVHDFIVQARGAFEQTVLGILNLGRTGIPVEIRIVVHQRSLPRLKQLARFVARNLPFVSHIAFMGLEPTGYARSNYSALWADPGDYGPVLTAAVGELEAAGLECRIYNHPLCLLPEPLRQKAQRSISDWKNIFLPECDSCARRTSCCGFFASAWSRHSTYVRPFST
jgi:His-Xaa-Ser system radical SAM maturase HxsC